MKKLFSVLAALSMMISCTSCGLLFTSVPVEEVTVPAEEIPATETVISAEVATEQLEKADPTRQDCRKTINNPEKPEITKIFFEGVCSEDIRKHAQVTDLYNIDMLHSGVVGLVGIPIEITYDDEIKEPRIGFEYDTDELRGIPEKNLVMLHYSESDQFYNTVEDVEVDTDKCTVSADIEEQGVYLLADAYQWYGCWGMDVSEYAYERDMTQYKTDWEREADTGSITALANKEWAMENAPDFHVSTAEQLASVVWYVNGIDGNANITLEKDIDLSDYQWKPMGWGKGFTNGYSGTVDGQGHTIYGMTIIEDYLQSGFIGYGTEVSVKNINFEDAYVSSTHCTGIVGGELYMSGEWENVHVQGRVDGGKEDYAGIVGREADISFKNCSADVIVNGEEFEYLSYRQKREAEVEIVETFTLTLNDDYTITRDNHEGFSGLGWMILRNEEQVLHRSAVDYKTKEPELVLDTHRWVGNEPAEYTVYLVAYINGTYIRVSNIVEYELN